MRLGTRRFRSERRRRRYHNRSRERSRSCLAAKKLRRRAREGRVGEGERDEGDVAVGEGDGERRAESAGGDGERGGYFNRLRRYARAGIVIRGVEVSDQTAADDVCRARGVEGDDTVSVAAAQREREARARRVPNHVRDVVLARPRSRGVAADDVREF